MDKLEAKLKSLTEKYDSLQRELKEVNSTASQLSYKSDAIQFEIKLIHDGMRIISGDIDEDVKICLFEDLNMIEKLHYPYRKCNMGEIFTLALVYDEQLRAPYVFEIKSPSLYQCYIEITTRSKMICDVIRKCFSNSESCGSRETSEVYKMNETLWIMDRDGCCSRNFTYDADLAKSMLCPEFNHETCDDRDSYSRRVRLGL
jgi:hypothetical protein